MQDEIWHKKLDSLKLLKTKWQEAEASEIAKVNSDTQMRILELREHIERNAVERLRKIRTLEEEIVIKEDDY